MTTQLFQSGGVQTTVILPQIIYLDFDGELTRYNGELLTIDSVTVEDSGLTAERIAAITATLNQQFRDQNVLFVSDLSDLSDLSDQSDYSTIYVGKTSSFEPYGSFAGLAETVDSGNKIRNDNAFVILDSLSSDDRIADVIAHEAGHLLGILDHGGEGLKKYGRDRCIYVVGRTSSGITLAWNDSMYVCSGGKVNNTSADSRGLLYIYSGGTADCTTVWGGSMFVSDGGGACNTVVKYNGYLYISSGGCADRNTVSSGGGMVISCGGSANSTTVDSGGRLYVAGEAKNINVQEGGALYVTNGGTALSIVENGGYVSGADDATVTFLPNIISNVSLSCCATIHSGTTANSGTINNTLCVFSGGTANSISVNSGGCLQISNGGTVCHAVVNHSGGLDIFSGGTAMDVAANCGAKLKFTVASNTYIQGQCDNSSFLMQNAYLSNYTINSNGCLDVESNGMAECVTINDGGQLNVCHGGTANSTTVNTGGCLYVSSGGTALSIMENGGYVHISSGAHITFIANSFCYSVLSGGATLHSGTTANSTTVNNFGVLSVFSGGTANNTMINSNGWMYVFSGGKADYTTVCSSGCLRVSGGTVNSTTIANGGQLYILDGGTANATLIDGIGDLNVNGGTVSCTTVRNSGYLNINSGGVADSTAVGSGGIINVHNGGMINSTTVNERGCLKVFSSGVADSTTVELGGTLNVFYGGTALAVRENGGYVYCDPNASITFQSNSFSGFVLSGGNSATIHSGTAANSTTVNGGMLSVFSGGEISSTSVNGGVLSVFSGGKVSCTAVNSGGILSIDGAAVVNTVNVCSSGEIVIANNGQADRLTVVSGGIINHFSFDQDLYWETVQGSSITISDSWTITDNTIYIDSDQKAEEFTIHSGGTVILNGTAEDLQIKAGGRLDQFVFGEDLAVCKDSSGVIRLASGVTVEEQLLTVSSGGVLNGISLYGSAAVQIASGATVSGFLRNSCGWYTGETSNVSIESGAKIDLTVTGPCGSALIENVSSAELSNADFSITIDTPEVGSYILYNGDLSPFYNKNISVKTASGMDLGTLSVNDTYTVLSDGQYGYRLNSNSGTLSLDVLGRIWINGGYGRGTYSGLNNWVYAEPGDYYAELPYGYTVYNWSYGMRSHAGTSYFTPYCQILSVSGEDITSGCQNAGLISGNDGYVTVDPASCSVSLKDYTKVYDGEFLTSDFIRDNLLTADGLCEDDEIQISWIDFHGASANAGQYSYTVNFSIRSRSWAQDVTDCYCVNGGYCYGGSGSTVSVTGNLTITPREVVLTSGDAVKNYDGTPLTNNNVSVSGDGWFCGWSGCDGAYYDVTGSQTEVGSSPNTFTYTLCEGTNPDNYVITTKEGTLTVEKIAGVITVTANSASKMYDGKALTDSGYTYTQGVLLAGDELEVVVEGTITDAGTAANKVVSCKVMRGETDVTSCYNFNAFVDGELTITPRNIQVQTGDASKVYDGTALQNDSVILSGDGFVKGQGANFTTVSLLEAGTVENSVTAVKYRSGTKAENYNVTYEYGTLEVTPCAETITVTADSAAKVYDGMALAAGYTYTGNLMQGDTLAVTVEGSITDAGTTANRITGVRVMHGDIDVTASYAGIKSVDGILEISKCTVPITITADSVSRKYDGTELTAGYTYSGTLAATDELVVTVKGSITDAGTAANAVTGWKVMRGNTDATANYTCINSVDGVLSITPRNVAMTSADDTKSYDGTPLVNHIVTVSGDGWASGEGASYHVSGSQLEAGSSPNTFSYTLNDGTEAENYKITATEGTLTVTPCSEIITITADSITKMYDGEALTGGYTYTGSLAAGDELIVTVEGTITDAGTVVNAITDYKIMRGERDVTGNYRFGAVTDGLLTVTRRDITITSADDWMVYDGSPLSNHSVIFSGSGFISGQGVSVTFAGSQTEIGTSLNTFTYVPNTKTDLKNYAVTRKYGALAVLPDADAVVLVASSAEKEYDGTALTADYFCAGNLQDGDELSVTVDGSIIEVGSAVSRITGYKIMRGSTDVTSLYNITTVDGTLTVKDSVSPYQLQGTEDGISWKGTADTYMVEYSTEQFEHVLELKITENGVDTFAMPEDSYQWRVRYSDSETWSESAFAAGEKSSPESYVSEANGKGDIFFAKGSEVWESGYAAEHVGCGSWSGTGEQVELAGKNQITDVFVGSVDANILVMTDDENGDALFVDDIYSAFPGEQQSRIAQIDEIRAGAGDDVVDMTSQRFVYSEGVTIRGGAGNDTIWANSGDNKLFGDAGNDRIAGASGNDVFAGGIGNDSMHGGGGDDIFCFCKGWGQDTVEQLTGGSVTLWFADNSGFWDQSTMTYTQGDNTVKVSGVTQVTLKYGDDTSELYDTLAAVGCFMAESSEKIYEEPGKGVIAQL